MDCGAFFNWHGRKKAHRSWYEILLSAKVFPLHMSKNCYGSSVEAVLQKVCAVQRVVID